MERLFRLNIERDNMMLGGTAGELMSMGTEAMLPFQRVMIALTLRKK